MAIHDLLAALKTSVKIAYLDDVSLIGAAETVAEDFVHICTAAKAIGLECNSSKCEVIPLGDGPSTASLNISFPSVRVIQSDEATLLGAALGKDVLDDLLRAHVDQLRRLSVKIGDLHAHDAFYLLKNCLSAPKLLFTLRTLPCFAAKELDVSIQKSLTTTLNVDIGPAQWRQASLPTRLGGLGIPSPSAIASAAYMASVTSTSALAARISPTAGVAAETEIAMQD